MKFDVIVIGGGAAGLMCEIEAGKRGRRVAILEHGDRLGKKILISGGGALQFHELWSDLRELRQQRQSSFLQVRLGPLHSRRFHRPG